MRRIPVPLAVIALVFLAAMAWIVASSLASRQVPTYQPRVTRGLPIDTVTLDASDEDHWRFFAFDRGALTPPDTADWDLAVQRFRIRAPGVVLRSDTVSFAAFRESPGESTHPSQDLGRWYRYSMFSHLLYPKPFIYVIRTRDGRFVKLEFLSYYCPGPEPGCVTFRYSLLR
jgi:hypothetical protein